MQVLGHIQNGVVVLDPGVFFPEGTRVAVIPSPVAATIEKRRVEFPLVRTEVPGTWNLTKEQMGEILDDEDASALKDQWNASS